MHQKKDFKHQLIGCCLGLALMSPLISIAEHDENQEATDQWRLWAKPRICVLPANKIYCEMQSQLAWESEGKASVCLFSSQQASDIKCWQEALNGELAYWLRSSTNIDFWLSYPEQEKPLIKTTVHVVNLPERRVRKRRRRIWSLM